MEVKADRGATSKFAMLVCAVLLGYLAAQVALAWTDPHAGRLPTTLIEAGVLAAVTSVTLWFTVIRQFRTQARVQTFVAKLNCALDMTSSERWVYGVVERAVESLDIGGTVRLLLADSSNAHLKDALEREEPPVITPTCTVVSPFDCPAVHDAQTKVFEHTRALDACPWLTDGVGRSGDIGAVCVPLKTIGKAIGVLQVTATPNLLPTRNQVDSMAALAQHAGHRLGLLRVMEQNQLQASTDPLTGLLNRRILEIRTHELLRSGNTFSLAMADLDHFKQLNDSYGHDMGDRALLTFAQTLRRTLRNDDVIARYGGEEFVILFPGQPVTVAAAALERVREALALAVVAAAVPSFTASFGVASPVNSHALDQLIRSADAALFRAKREGRNRVIVAGSECTVEDARAAASLERGVNTQDAPGLGPLFA